MGNITSIYDSMGLIPGLLTVMNQLHRNYIHISGSCITAISGHEVYVGGSVLCSVRMQ